MIKSDIGLIGLGVMGSNLARNIARNNFHISIFNRTTQKTKDLIEQTKEETDKLHSQESLEDFVNSLQKPRKIIILVKAGDAVDSTIQSLLALLDKNDLIIDCGNSKYQDTIKREIILKEQGILFQGTGISGGEEGALNGPSIMPGGSTEAYELTKEIYEQISAKDFQGNPCVANIGPSGSGHFIKMVHNGIEYAIMQAIAETYHSIKHKPQEEIISTFKELNNSSLESYLLEITIKILEEKEGDLPLLEMIKDTAAQKGTGKWTQEDAAAKSIATPSIAAAVTARIISSKFDTRQSLSSQYKKEDQKELLITASQIKSALECSIISIYDQAFTLINETSKENSWNLKNQEIARIWQGGCIIRAKILSQLQENNSSEHIFSLEPYRSTIQNSLEDWKALISTLTIQNIPNQTLSDSLNYFQSLTSNQLPANLIQAQRDFFGAHTFERVDKPGVFHNNWDK